MARHPRIRTSESTDPGNFIDLVWLWFRSPHFGLAARMMRTSEPPHQRRSLHDAALPAHCATSRRRSQRDGGEGALLLLLDPDRLARGLSHHAVGVLDGRKAAALLGVGQI